MITMDTMTEVSMPKSIIQTSDTIDTIVGITTVGNIEIEAITTILIDLDTADIDITTTMPINGLGGSIY